MAILVITKVGNELIQVTRVGLEGTTRREMDVSNDLVYPDTS
jgi:hypothetical protein